MRWSPWVLCVLLLLGVGCAARSPGAEATLDVAFVEAEADSTVLVRRPPRSSGRLDGDLVGRQLYERRARLAACYRDSGGVAAGRGVVYALLDVNSGGQVRRSTIGHSDVRDRRFERCLDNELRSLDLPATGDQSLVQAHLVFGAVDDEEGRAMMSAYRASRPGDRSETEPMELAGLRGRIQPCYERALRRTPNLSGRTVLHLVLDEDGSVADAAFSSGDGIGDGLGRCVLGVVRNLRFRREDASVATLSYPVILQPGAY